MKDLQASASAGVAAAPEACTALLAAVDRYPSWYPEVIRDAEALERDAAGTPLRARATVHMMFGPLARDFEQELAVAVQPGREVTLTRIPGHAGDPERFEVRWLVTPASQARLELQLIARLEVPRLLPLGGAGEALAQGFVEAAARALSGSSPNASASSS
jgi:hypothetical protein